MMAKKPIWEWIPNCQQVFDTLKAKFVSAPMLLMPDKMKPFIIESDASLVATGAVLRQTDVNGDLHPCGYLSKSFNPAERNYEIYDRELLGIVRTLEEWCHYLDGSLHPIVIHSDHKNLTYYRTAQKLNRRQAPWSLFLSQFELQLVHVPGMQMIQSDTLSRLLGKGDRDHDNEDRILLPEALFMHSISTQLY
ncbi:hypothetical protein SCP_0806020 [Sparassis crispa]|uniref:Reverse transcriptase RNase H-like domain-containing protein n=1 Tax=Sparassis crispa TaxID=139825 RepID=A0A401GV30_9APHY|nr:hypothetical protein SCP_0806020 [Sparassis crispa]GBE86078.1 hypothetical protein SCP_0806020 [Sparassis crispa]